MNLPDRLLLGPGPSPVSSRVMRALAQPVLSHLDPALLKLMDDTRDRLARVFQSAAGSFSFLVSGTGTSAMEACVANLAAPGTRALAIVNGYFGDRIARMLQQYGAEVERVESEWGEACDPESIRRTMKARRADLISVVHAETSTGVRNPVADVAAIAREHDSIVITDAVTSLGAVPVTVGEWQIDACYSCSQKGLSAPSGMAPVTFGPRALERRVPCRSFYLDVRLLQEYWLQRKYHHTLCSTLLVAVHEALVAVEEEGLNARWDRHEQAHRAFAAGLQAIEIGLLPPARDRLPNLNAVRVPPGVDEAAVRRHLLEESNIEIGAGLGPLAGKIWRVGLMGEGAKGAIVVQLLAALERALAASGYRMKPGAAVGAASAELEREPADTTQ